MVPDACDEDAGVDVVVITPYLLAARGGRVGNLGDEEVGRQALCPV